MPDIPANRAIEAVWRIEAPKLIAGLTRRVRDVGLAEELAQEALVAAMVQWPTEGAPRNPGAWLMAIAKRRAYDYFRHNAIQARKLDALAYDIATAAEAPDLDQRLDDDIGDDLLSLIFTACHPVLSPEARLALTLRLLGGLSTTEIARAFLVPEPTIAQRIVRAKKSLAAAGLPFEVPHGPERNARMASVLEVVYLIFNEGYAATAGDDWIRTELVEQALRLGRVVVGLAPDTAEVHGLVALMELQASRSGARTAPDGAAILLAEQDRTRWDRTLINHGLAALGAAERLAGDAPGPYQLQAAIAACHVRANTSASTDWPTIATLYTLLFVIQPNPVVAVNRAVAYAMAFGADKGLALLDELAAEPVLSRYHLLPAVRGDLLEKLGRLDEARAEFLKSASLTQNARERALLLRRLDGMVGAT